MLYGGYVGTTVLTSSTIPLSFTIYHLPLPIFYHPYHVLLSENVRSTVVIPSLLHINLITLSRTQPSFFNIQ